MFPMFMQGKVNSVWVLCNFMKSECKNLSWPQVIKSRQCQMPVVTNHINYSVLCNILRMITTSRLTWSWSIVKLTMYYQDLCYNVKNYSDKSDWIVWEILNQTMGSVQYPGMNKWPLMSLTYNQERLFVKYKNYVMLKS